MLYLYCIKHKQMEKINKYTVNECPGSQRKSPRNYSHAIIGEKNYSQMIAREKSTERFEYYKSIWRMASERLHTIEIGAMEHGTSGYVYTQERHDKDMAIIQAHETPESYAVVQTDGRVHMMEMEMAKNQPEVLQWSQSHANAVKKVGYWSQFYLNVRVVETQKVN